ncbi:carboxypeptidase-like regulatory domain-containing protein [Flavobacterium silvaticum]|uniref:Carboxypeptidase-like regulatory domain-containing protein n=1 Tax=Flavobacterium silvaticum TaxID=1852020 RepID=A0A972FMH8_9FLAO|nr:carboxypeptidase-like regulatory domain-containing protein [Flavobacterium silvaticum]NMH28397.1 carboxypeptidase-like regulatory domain-containing protein [Flavobacterium silvaticum]
MRKLLLSLLLPMLSCAQLSGVVRDSISGNPVPYANIWIEDSKKGTNANEKGEFELGKEFSNASLVFSAIGYETKKIKGNFSAVNLNPVSYQLDQVEIKKPFGNKSIKLSGFTGSWVLYQTNLNMAKFFPSDEKVLKHPYLKEITFRTVSQKEDCVVNLRFLQTDQNGFPGQDMLDENILVPVTKGDHNTTFNVERYHVKVPEGGIFIVIERLIIPENRLTTETKAKSLSGGKRILKSYSYEPTFGLLPSEVNDTWNWTGKWKQDGKEKLSNPQSYENLLMRKYHDKFKTAALSITLTD